MSITTSSVRALRPMAILAIALLAGASPVLGQKAKDPAADAEARIKKLEAEVKAVQRQVFPGADGKYFTPEIQKADGTAPAPAGTPATTPVTDLLSRMDAVEAQLSRITAQNEESGNRIAQLEAKIAALTPPPAPAPAPAAAPAADNAPANLIPATANPAPAPASAAPKPSISVVPPATTPAAAKPAAVQPLAAPKPAAATPAKPAPASRVAAVKAVEKPKTADAGDDEYSYGYRLWEAKFYPEAVQQLNLFLDKYPKHQRVSYARNLLGRVLLDDDKPYEAGQWFLKNYQADKKGARAPDSLLYLGEAMRQLKHNDRACVALKEFADVYATEAAGRLKSQYEATRKGAKCN